MWGNLLLIFTMLIYNYGDKPQQIANIFPSFDSIWDQNTHTKTNSDNTSSKIPQIQNQRLSMWLYQEGFDINPQLLEILQNIINYADEHQIAHSSILTLIDYSLPANQKRLWVLDLDKQKILFHTYVSHGLKTGTLESRFFSNRFDSKASSIGVYLTDKPYYGRHGISLKLNGLEYGFNDNAESRAIVMHGGWYVEENFIHKYGRAGRSWGCPAVPDQEISPIINTIKDKGLLVIYYPSAEWFKRSRFLKHDTELMTQSDNHLFDTNIQESEEQEDILLAQLQKKNKFHENEAILVMPVDRYSSLFTNQVPLKRMLRRQIDDQEYIALSNIEFNQLLEKNAQNSNSLQDIYFVVPSIKMVRGYYATEMNKIDLGKILAVQHNTALASDTYTLNLDNQASIHVKTSHRFIRWLGL